MSSSVAALHRSDQHSFSKFSVDSVELIAGDGVAGDAHAGAQVKHRSRVAADPTQPNLRQVHLIHQELFDQVAEHGHEVSPGDLGENITTAGLDLLGLPVGATLSIGADAIVVLTGLRNPCAQIEDFQPGLLQQVRPVDEHGKVSKLCGVMGMVVRGGTVTVGDAIAVGVPGGAHHALVRV